MILNGIITGLIMGGILSLPVLGVAVIYGITGIPNFAIGVIGVFGGFVTWYFLSFNMGLAILFGVVVCFFVGVVLQRILLTPISEKGGDSTLFFILTVSVGFVFETPIIIMFLARMGLVTPQWLARRRKLWVILAFVIFVIGSLLIYSFPTPDPKNPHLEKDDNYLMLHLFEIGGITALILSIYHAMKRWKKEEVLI